MKGISHGFALLALGALCAGCATALSTPVAGADQLTVTKNAADVTGCTPVGNVDGHLAQGNYPEGMVQVRNQTVGLGGDTLFMTDDPAEHVIGPPNSFFPMGVAYRCGKTAAH